MKSKRENRFFRIVRMLILTVCLSFISFKSYGQTSYITIDSIIVDVPSATFNDSLQLLIGDSIRLSSKDILSSSQLVFELLDTNINLMEQIPNIRFTYFNVTFGCKSQNIAFIVDSLHSTQDSLVLKNIEIKNHFFYYLPEEVCKSDSIISPTFDNNFRDTNLLVDAGQGISFTQNSEIDLKNSVPGIYSMNIVTEFCLDETEDTIEIIDPTTDFVPLPSSIKVCEQQLQFNQTYPDYKLVSIGTDSIIYLSPDISQSGNYEYEHQGMCKVTDVVDIQFIPLQEVRISVVDECEKAKLSVQTTATNYTLNWWNGKKDGSTSTSKSEQIWVEMTYDDNCKVADTIDVSFKPYSVEFIEYSVVNSDCWNEGVITISNTIINNAKGGQNIVLRNKLNNTVVENLDAVPEGIYEINITDKVSNCSTKAKKEIVVLQKCLEEFPIFSPDNDGLQDDYFIPYQGTVKIFNREGILLRELETPAYWDGTDESGDLLPMGNYIMITDNEKVVNITIIK